MNEPTSRSNCVFDEEADSTYRKLVTGYIEIYNKAPWNISLAAIAAACFLITNIDKIIPIAGRANTEITIIFSGLIAVVSLAVYAIHNHILSIINFQNITATAPTASKARVAFYSALRFPSNIQPDVTNDVHEIWKPVLWQVKISRLLRLFLYILLISTIGTFIQGVFKAEAGKDKAIGEMKEEFRNYVLAREESDEAYKKQVQALNELCRNQGELIASEKKLTASALEFVVGVQLALKNERNPSRNVEVAMDFARIAAHALGALNAERETQNDTPKIQLKRAEPTELGR